MSIELIQQKNLPLDQINAASLPEQKTALIQLRINIKSKNWSLHKAENTQKRRWLVKRPKINLTQTLTKQGKTFLIPSATAA